MINRTLKYPLWVGLAVFILILVSILGMLRINLDVNFNDYFAHDDAQFIGLQKMQQRFAQRNSLLLLLENQQDWRQVEQESELINFINQLQADSTIISVGGYGTFIADLNTRANAHQNKTDTSLQYSQLLAYKKHPRLPLVINETGTAIVLSIQFSEREKNNYPNATLWREKTIDNLLAKANGFWSRERIESSDSVKIYLSGEQALNWQYAKVLRHDLTWFAPSLLLIIALMALLFIRTRVWLLAIAINCIITLFITLGLAGWLNLTIAAISAFIPVIIITLSLAYSAHLYLAWQQGIKQGIAEPVKFSFEHNKQPLFYATLTTMLGFALLSFSPSPPIQSFGVLVSVAVVCHYLLCHSVLVIIVSKAQNKSVNEPFNSALLTVEAIAKNSTKVPKLMLITVTVISILSLISASKLELNDDPFSYFPSDNPFSQSKQKMQQYFDGVNLIHYEISTKEQAIYDKQYLAFLYQFARFLKQQPEVKRVTHIGDWVKSAGLNQSQFQRVINQNSVERLGLEAEISTDYQSSLVSLYLAPLTARQMIDFEQRVSMWLIDNQTDIGVSHALGSSLLFAHLSIDNAKNMLWSFAIALVLLSMILGFIKRSMMFAAIGLVVNFLPLLWVFAAWQLTGGYISIGSAVVLGIMLGIIVDDTLHLLLKLPQPKKAASFESFWPRYAAIIPVISFTSLTLVLGFGIGLASDFAPIAQLSLLSCLVIVLAWLFDVLVLPVIYHQWRRYLA
ncbi:MMPL family transporter [Shewanella sp. 10N.7]|uniref:efflux RND transporter permease subunit n=1 Tax=Shewanella sp. 10N.7 TaxID=2885093 RepID=UPI001E438312|nr:MMPL family transporter [Shewanella sp. 10N.7]MCC4831716.1 MMPL family transporter [Shewanella sp. 10N.7]